MNRKHSDCMDERNENGYWEDGKYVSTDPEQEASAFDNIIRNRNDANSLAEMMKFKSHYKKHLENVSNLFWF
jgi:hypothetical protein